MQYDLTERTVAKSLAYLRAAGRCARPFVHRDDAHLPAPPVP